MAHAHRHPRTLGQGRVLHGQSGDGAVAVDALGEADAVAVVDDATPHEARLGLHDDPHAGDAVDDEGDLDNVVGGAGDEVRGAV